MSNMTFHAVGPLKCDLHNPSAEPNHAPLRDLCLFPLKTDPKDPSSINPGCCYILTATIVPPLERSVRHVDVFFVGRAEFHDAETRRGIQCVHFFHEQLCFRTIKTNKTATPGRNLSSWHFDLDVPRELERGRPAAGSTETSMKLEVPPSRAMSCETKDENGNIRCVLVLVSYHFQFVVRLDRGRMRMAVSVDLGAEKTTKRKRDPETETETETLEMRNTAPVRPLARKGWAPSCPAPATTPEPIEERKEGYDRRLSNEKLAARPLAAPPRARPGPLMPTTPNATQERTTGYNPRLPDANQAARPLAAHPPCAGRPKKLGYSARREAVQEANRQRLLEEQAAARPLVAKPAKPTYSDLKAFRRTAVEMKKDSCVCRLVEKALAPPLRAQSPPPVPSGPMPAPKLAEERMTASYVVEKAPANPLPAQPALPTAPPPLTLSTAQTEYFITLVSLALKGDAHRSYVLNEVHPSAWEFLSVSPEAEAKEAEVVEVIEHVGLVPGAENQVARAGGWHRLEEGLESDSESESEEE